jgi:hypothetical protein
VLVKLVALDADPVFLAKKVEAVFALDPCEKLLLIDLVLIKVL